MIIIGKKKWGKHKSSILEVEGGDDILEHVHMALNYSNLMIILFKLEGSHLFNVFTNAIKLVVNLS